MKKPSYEINQKHHGTNKGYKLGCREKSCVHISDINNDKHKNCIIAHESYLKNKERRRISRHSTSIKNIKIIWRTIIAILIFCILAIINYEFISTVNQSLGIHQLSDLVHNTSYWTIDDEFSVLFLLLIFIISLIFYGYVVHLLRTSPIRITYQNKSIVNNIFIILGLSTIAVKEVASPSVAVAQDNVTTHSIQNIDHKEEQKNNEDTHKEEKKQPEIYTIKSGDTLWEIAESHCNSPLDSKNILKNNNNQYVDGTTINIHNLHIGKQILISAELLKHPTVNEDTTIIIKSGDTLAGIAKSYLGDESRWHDIAKFNNITNPKSLHTGNTIIIPNIIKAKQQMNSSSQVQEKTKQTPEKLSTLPSSTSSPTTKGESHSTHTSVSTKNAVQHSITNSTRSNVIIYTTISSALLAVAYLCYSNYKKRKINQAKNEVNSGSPLEVIDDKPLLDEELTIHTDILNKIQQLINYLSIIDKSSSILYILAKEDRFYIRFEHAVNDEKLVAVDDSSLYEVLYADIEDMSSIVEKSAVVEIGQIGEDRLFVDLFHINRLIYAPYESMRKRIVTFLKYAPWTLNNEFTVVGNKEKFDSFANNLSYIAAYNDKNLSQALKEIDDIEQDGDDYTIPYLMFIDNIPTREELEATSKLLQRSNIYSGIIFNKDVELIKPNLIIEHVKDANYLLKIDSLVIEFVSDINELEVVKKLESKEICIRSNIVDRDGDNIKPIKKIEKTPRFVIQFFNGFKVIDTKSNCSVPNIGPIMMQKLGYYALFDKVTEDFMINLWHNQASARMGDSRQYNRCIRDYTNDQSIDLISREKDNFGIFFKLNRELCDADYRLIDDVRFTESLQKYIINPLPYIDSRLENRIFIKIKNNLIDRIYKHIEDKLEKKNLKDVDILIDKGLIIDDRSYKIWMAIAGLGKLDQDAISKYKDRALHLRYLTDREDTCRDVPLIEYVDDVLSML